MAYCWILYWLFLSLLPNSLHLSSPNTDQPNEFLQIFRQRIEGIFKNVTKFDKLRDILHQQLNDGILQEHNIEVDDVSKIFAEHLRTLLLSYLDDLNNIKRQVKKSKEAHIFDADIEPFNYYNDKQNNTVQSEPLFSTSIKVNLNQSFGQVPTDIFKNDKTILNDFYWLKDLDTVFLRSFKNKPTLLWQYFASENGASKNYPGVNYDGTKVDLYDPRRRIWYNSATMSPKDVVIAVDMSGSMTGLHLIIAKLAIHALIDTFQQDDYFNVISFNKDVEFFIPCLKNLSEATTVNKVAFKDQIHSLKDPTGEADLPGALQTAFEILNQTGGSVNDLATSGCSKVIMIISDGVRYDDRTYEILQKYNGDKQVIIFSFIVGLNADPEMKEIACSFGGDFYQIQTKGNVLEGVLKYRKVLSKPIGNIGTDHVTFTPLYLDGSGLGMMTTISTGVFVANNQTAKTELIGVAGLDIVISLLQQQYPKEKMGVFGHAFAINNNGLFLMHPRFKDQSGYLPDPATVYLTEVENTVDSKKAKLIEQAMIDGKTGCIQAAADWLYPKEINTRMIRLNYTYCYRPLADTPFFAGVAVPNQNKVRAKANKEKISMYMKSGINALAPGLVDRRHQIAAWSICEISTEESKKQPASIKYYPTSEDLHEYLSTTTTDSLHQQCQLELLHNLLLSSSTILNFTESSWAKIRLPENEILDVYVITTSGFMMSMSDDFNASTPIKREIFEDARYSHPASHFGKESKHYSIFTVETKIGRPLPLSKQDTALPQKISIGQVVYAEEGDNVLVVVGMTIFSKVLVGLMNETFQQQRNAPPDSFSFNCHHSDRYQCYLIDENGYVVASNQGNYQVGYFLGYFNGNLVSKLTDLSIFYITKWKDTQADCPKHFHGTSSCSVPLKAFYKSIFTSLFTLTKQISSITFWVFSSIFWTATTRYNTVNAQSGVHKNISCTKEVPLYTVQNATIDFSGTLPCLVNCNQSYTIKSIPGTNLALIVTGNDCKDAEKCPVRLVHNEPVRVIAKSICEQALHYRRPVTKCYKSTGEGKECDFEYTNTDKKMFIYLIVGFSVSFAIIVISVTLATHCRRWFY